MDNRHPQASFSQRLLAYLICALVAWQPLLPTLAAEITPAGTNTQLDKAANGVPVINIAPPNQAGISHNQYQTYNVGPEGLILNNATGQLTQTQLGGLIQNNPNLKAGQEAHAIINEVTGANRSQLRGYTEVAGKAANVMVANPYGITCNGCGFINTPNVTLTTGKPTFDAQGNLQSLEVSKGSITVEGQGLDGSQSDALSIIARATDVNAAIHAKDLKVIAGANRVAADGSLTPIAGDGAAPSVAVDTGALGGMYANRIHLVSSDKGVGVNLGNLNARQGDITLNANGKLVVNTTLTSGALTAKGERVELHGEHKASGAIAINGQAGVSVQDGTLVSDGAMALSSNGTLQLSHTALTAGQDIQLAGHAITQDSASRAEAARAIHLAADGTLLTEGTLNATQALTLTGGTLNNSGTLLAGGQVQSSMNALTNRGTLQSGQGMVLNGASVANQGALLSGDTLAITADTLSQDGTLSAQGAGTLTLRDGLRNNGKLLSNDRLTLNTGTLEQNGTLSGEQGVVIDSDTMTGSEGSVTRSQSALTLKANRALLNGNVSAGGDLVLQGNQLTSGKSAQLQSDGDATFIAQQATLDGTQAAKGTLSMSADNMHHGGKSNAARIQIDAPEMENSGTLTAPDITVTSQSLTNSGLLQGEQSLHLLTTQLDNLSDGTIHTAGDLTLAIPVINNDGLVTGDSALALSGDRLTNRGEINAVTLSAATHALFNEAPGLLLAKGQLAFSGDALDNAGQLAAETLAVTHGQLTNRGTLQGDKALAVTAESVTNQGELLSGGTLTLDADTLDNAGELHATDMLLTLAKRLTNQSNGNLLTTGHLALHTPLLENAGQIAADTLTTEADALTNLGRLQGTAAFTQRGTTLDNQQAGVLISNGTLDLQQTRLTNAGLLQGGMLNLATGEWMNSGNALSEQDGLFKVEHRLVNSGKILGQQGITLQAEQIDNRGWLIAKVAALQGDLINSGLIQGSDNVQVQGGELSNSGQLLSGDALTIDGDTLDNQGALQGRTVKVQARDWQNSGSALAENAFNAVLAGDLMNSGSLLGQESLNLSAASITNLGTLAANQLSLDAPLLTNSGLLQGNRSLSLTTSQLSNTTQGQLLSGGSLSLSPVRLENAGLLQANEDFTFHGLTLINQGRIAATTLMLEAGDALENHAGGQLVAQEDATLKSTTLNNDGTLAGRSLTLTGGILRNNGTAQGDQRLDITADTLVNQTDGQLLSSGSLTLQGGDAQNSGMMQAEQLGYTLSHLDNSGSLNGISGLSGSVTGDLINHGQLWSNGDSLLNSGRMINSGKIAADNLTLRAGELTNDGLWQGSNGLVITGDTLTIGQPGRALSGGDLTLTAGQLTTHGTLQGQQATITADTWLHDGSLLAIGALNAAITGTLQNNGHLLGKEDAQLNARTLNNQGALLSEGDLTLDGTTLNNSGAVQGNTLTVHPTQITNQGTLTGLHALTLGTQPPAFARMLRVMAVASAAPPLLNSGALLTQGALTINGGNGRITNTGSLQGQTITLHAGDLIQNGTIQSADALELVLANTLVAGANSKISANGQAALQALTLSNQGQWIAKNLSLKGGALDNNGAISGVEGLAVNLTGNLTQQQDKTLLSGGALTLNAASVNN